MTNGEICDGSSSAAVNLPSGLRVYFQDRDGYVREARQENGIWRGGTCQNILFRAKPGSPLAATAWGDNHIRVYYINPSGCLQEFCTDSGVTGDWSQSDFRSPQGYELTPDTCLAATSWDDHGVHIRVYFQDTRGTIYEWRNDSGPWVYGATLPTALMGTSIAVVDLQVYYQDVKGWLRDYISGPRGWQQGNLLVEVPPRTPLAAVYWRDNGDVRVYYRSYSNEVVEIVYAENKWRARPNRLTACIGNSQISAALRDSIEVFYQQNPNALQEYRTDGGCWRTRTEVPTGMRV